MLEILSSIGFIVGFTIVGIIATIIALENQREGVASGFVSLILALLLFNYWSDIWSFISTETTSAVYFTVGYVLFGVIWSFIKWNEKAKNVFVKYTELKNQFIKEVGEIDITNESEFIRRMSHKFTDSDNETISFSGLVSIESVAKRITPMGTEYKTLITSWMMYWPVSLLGTLINNPFRRFFKWVFDSISSRYDAITKRHRDATFG